MSEVNESMTAHERRSALWLAGIYALRMMGLFMILPVFALFAGDLEGSTPALAGLAIGIYGLTQAALQIPFGMLSDRFGRKRIIVIGLIIFVLGSVLAAVADSIGGVIAGRALQGAGAISAAVMALAADLTREEQRTKVMAIIGVSIGASFAVSMVLGPLLSGWIGVQGIFWFTAILALLGIVAVLFGVPNPVRSGVHREAVPVPAQFKRVLGDRQLLRLNLGIGTLHLVLTATFVVLPLALRDSVGFAAENHWKIYLPALVLGIAFAVPFIILAEKKRKLKQVFIAAISTLALAELALWLLEPGLLTYAILMLVFFSAFNLLEASLPSLISKTAPPDAKGTAMGVYASGQFFGAFLGGALGGWAHSHWGLQSVFLIAALACIPWLVAAYTMQPPRHASSYLLKVGDIKAGEAAAMADRLGRVSGVEEAVVIAEDGVAYLKVDKKILDIPALRQIAMPAS